MRAKSKAADRSPKRTIVVRFRVTHGEHVVIQRAAAEDATDLEEELAKRGLSPGLINLRSANEWAREIVLRVAIEKLRSRDIAFPEVGFPGAYGARRRTPQKRET